MHRVTGAVAAGLALVAVGCGGSEGLKVYRDEVFELSRPRGGDWRMVARAEEFAVPPPAAQAGLPDVGRSKVLELTSRQRRATMEIYLVSGGAASAKQVMAAVQRRGLRRGVVEGEPKATEIGGRQAVASIATWRQTGKSPKLQLYCVRVPVADALWCFVGSAQAADFDAAKKDFKAVLRSVQFYF